MEQNRRVQAGGCLRVVFPLVLVVVFLIASCWADGGFPGMGSRAMELPEGIPALAFPDSDSPGAQLTARYCSQCYGIPSPKRHTAEEWDASARRMFRRMEHMAHMSRGMMGRMMHRGMADVRAPNAGEQQEILAYLRQHALSSVAAAQIPDVAGRDHFVRTCSRCHALPAPAQHTPEEWPAVVQRMQRTAERMKLPAIDATEAETITGYLQRATEHQASEAGGV